MGAPLSVHLPPIGLFTLDPSQTGGRKARSGFDFQDQYIAVVLAGFLVAGENLLAARIEAVEDLEVMIRAEDGWIERYYQIKTRQEGTSRWTILALDKEGVWTRFFSLYRQFLLRQTDQSRKVEFVIAVEGDLDADLIELRAKGAKSVSARAKLATILSAAVANEALSPDIIPQTFVDSLLDNFIATISFDSRVGHLRAIAFSKLIESGDLSPDEAQRGFEKLLDAIRSESARAQVALVTPSAIRDWLDFPERAILQTKPVPDLFEVRRDDLIRTLENALTKANLIALHGIPKIGKSHLVSSLIDHLAKNDSYFWFTFTGGDRDKDAFAFELASWIGQRTSVWQVRDDIERGRLLPEEVLNRLRKIRISNAYLIIDDCHKATDRGFLEAVATLVSSGWTDVKIIFVSEEKIPELATIGASDQRIIGLEPREAILFLRNLGIDVTGATAELAMLCIQADGHPALLRAIADELSPRPSPAEVTSLSNSLITAKKVQPFLQVLSERLMRSLKADVHRLWLSRLAVLTFSFRRNLALEIARLDPPLEVNAADWNFLVSKVFDQTGPDQYVVPTLLRPLLRVHQSQPNADAVLLASARHTFRTARASHRIDFWDFHSAIVALIAAKSYDEAAHYFIVLMGASNVSLPLSALELLFIILNQEFFHQNLDATTRFTLLLIEINTRLLDDQPPEYPRILHLFRQMRIVRRQLPLAQLSFTRTMIHMSAELARVRRIRDSPTVSAKVKGRAFASLEAALRSSMGQNNSALTLSVLEVYGQLYFLAKRPDVELLRSAIIRESPDLTVLSWNSLISLYAQFLISRNHDDEALAVCERHSAEYRAAGRAEAFFATEHAIGMILIERFKKYADARRRLAESSVEAKALGVSTEMLRRGDLLIADSYWAEKDYVSSASHYEPLRNVDLGEEALTQWVREKLADSLIFLRRFREASLQILKSLRKDHLRLSHTETARLYARLAYGYAQDDSLRKASIACLALRRLAEASAITEIDRLSVVMGGWVLQHFKYSDPAIPQGDVQIRDSSALSESISAEQLEVWKSSGPPLARGLMVVGTLFELLGELHRSEFLYRKAIDAAKLDEDQKRSRETEYTYQVRIARIQIRQHKFARAAATFKIAEDGLLKSGRQQVVSSTSGAAAYAILTLVEPTFEACSDQEMLEFFAEVQRQFATESGKRAWLMYRESELLFGRLLVQTAARTLTEAETLARLSGEYELLWVVLHSKLFVHIQQMYRDQALWFRDILETGLLLAKEHSLAPKRSEFAGVVARVTTQFESAIGEVSAVITELSNRSGSNQFAIALSALCKVAKRHHFAIGSLPEIEGILQTTIAGEDFN